PLFVIIKPIVGVATVTFGPELAGLVISGPVESPQQVTGLHEVIAARVACIIITAFLGTRQAGIGGQFKEFPHLLGGSGDRKHGRSCSSSNVLRPGYRKGKCNSWYSA